MIFSFNTFLSLHPFFSHPNSLGLVGINTLSWGGLIDYKETHTSCKEKPPTHPTFPGSLKQGCVECACLQCDSSEAAIDGRVVRKDL